MKLTRMAKVERNIPHLPSYFKDTEFNTRITLKERKRERDRERQSERDRQREAETERESFCVLFRV